MGYDPAVEIPLLEKELYRDSYAVQLSGAFVNAIEIPLMPIEYYNTSYARQLSGAFVDAAELPLLSTELYQTSFAVPPAPMVNNGLCKTVAIYALPKVLGDTAQLLTFDLLKPPIAAFHALLTLVPIFYSLQFYDDSENDPIAWDWDFGDGGVSHLQNPTHAYTTLGLKTVTLKVYSATYQDTLIKYNYIHVFSLSGKRLISVF